MYRKNRPECDCIECRSGKYNPRDYMLYEEDFERLDDERPLGITGHLRAKNEALSLGECIESCIDFLDELIITYNDSEDETEQIIKKYQKKYPKKIRVFYYSPTVTPHTYFVRYKNIEKTLEYPQAENIHNPANYYNFGYVKTSYRYYMKIDGDQIYFTEKMMKIRQNLVGWQIKIFTMMMKFLNIGKEKIYKKFHEKYQETKNDIYLYSCINIKYKEYALNLGGINIVGYKDDFIIPINMTDRLYYKLFNGCTGDTAIWVPVSQRKYIYDEKYMCEAITIPERWYQIGLCWLHLGLVKNRVKVDYNMLEYLNIQDLIHTKWENLIKKDAFKYLLNIENDYLYSIYTITGEKFWNQDIQYITEKYYNKYFPRVLDYYRNKIIK